MQHGESHRPVVTITGLASPVCLTGLASCPCPCKVERVDELVRQHWRWTSMHHIRRGLHRVHLAVRPSVRPIIRVVFRVEQI